MSKYGTNSSYPLNAYTCRECGERTVTIDVDDGVTPAMIRCRATAGCLGEAWSSWYRATDLAESDATHEWYRPNDDELERMSMALRHHVAMGGLDLREAPGDGNE